MNTLRSRTVAATAEPPDLACDRSDPVGFPHRVRMANLANLRRERGRPALETFQALANLLVGPPPSVDASEDEQIAWCERADEEMKRLDRREPNPDGNSDPKDAHQ